MLRSKGRVDFNNRFQIQSLNRKRGHNCRIVKQRSHLNIRNISLAKRIVNTQNSLQQIVVDADSVNSFKNRLDEFDKYFIDI